MSVLWFLTAAHFWYLIQRIVCLYKSILILMDSCNNRCNYHEIAQIITGIIWKCQEALRIGFSFIIIKVNELRV